MRHHKRSLLGYLAIPAFSTLLIASCTSAGPSAADGDHDDEAVGEAHDALTPEQCNYFDVNGTVQICHKTSSTTKPYTIIRVNEQACINAHSSHAEDYVTSLDPSSPLYDPTCGGQGCLAVSAPCDPTVPCCDGLTCQSGTCTDVNECALGTDNCDANATCTNTTGSFTCACNEGYEGDGVTCADVDECALGTDNCDANATCTNTPGSFSCACNAGYAGDGVTCADVDECALGTDNCDANAACTNTPGSFSCACNAGYEGDGVTCTPSAPPACGDGIVQAGEVCDDGNQTAGDGCSADCKGLEVCGDGRVDLATGESCDDGNTANGDGCDASCHVEPFQTAAPVQISGDLTCTTSVANAARKIAADGSGTIFAVMRCATPTGVSANVAVSTDRGLTYSAPLDLSTGISTSGAPVAQVAVASGPTGVGYVAIMLASGEVFLRTTQDKGATWSAAASLGTTASTSAGLSLVAFNDDIYVGFRSPTGIAVARNHQRGAGAFDITDVGMSVAFFDLVFDVRFGTLAVTADTPTFHIRTSSDGGVTFAPEANPPGSEFFSDWAIGNGTIFVSGTNLNAATGNSTSIFLIPASTPATSTSVSGLPLVTAAQTRSVAADDAGNAFVASQLNGGGVQLDRLPAGAGTFDTPRLIDPAGSSPVPAPLPGGSGAAVVYSVGNTVWATIQAY
ncbi:EGF domain-containing protein [Sorangium sp. So ce1389]|uniref:EGF domain-containing protein n=1 Tax=Sorangium sp. So ce1389 TaxID=3133336 RepID=UPI003F5F7C39